MSRRSMDTPRRPTATTSTPEHTTANKTTSTSTSISSSRTTQSNALISANNDADSTPSSSSSHAPTTAGHTPLSSLRSYDLHLSSGSRGPVPRMQPSRVLDNRSRLTLNTTPSSSSSDTSDARRLSPLINRRYPPFTDSNLSSPASPSSELIQDERSPLHRSASMPPTKYYVRVYFSPGMSEEVHASTPVVCVESGKVTQCQALVYSAITTLKQGKSAASVTGSHDDYELCETMCSSGYLCKERRLAPTDNPVTIQLLWPQATRNDYKFCLRRKRRIPQRSELDIDDSTPIHIAPGRSNISTIDEQTSFLTSILAAPRSSRKCPPDLCNLPDLSERTLLDNLRRRFDAGEIYTYVGSILIAVNPFRFLPVYNPGDVRRYTRLRKLSERPPHVFAIAAAAYRAMLVRRQDQCIVISGESGSGKTESTNFLLHHLSALSSNMSDDSRGLDRDAIGIEQLMLGAGPVLEGFGNAKTCHNNNSSRFGKFIQVQYSQNGVVQGAIVEKYLLEKSRIITQTLNERNYHVFYYLLAGAETKMKQDLFLSDPKNFEYLNKSGCYELQNMDGDTVDEKIEFQRLCQSMETVGFSRDIQQRIFAVLSAVLHIGNIQLKKAGHQHHEVVTIANKDEIKIISDLLKVRESTLIEALTKKRTMAGEESVIMNHTMADALATRDAMSKCLYSVLFDWIVLQLNRALLSKKESQEHQGNCIGVLDIFGFEDFQHNSFEQFCINFANEHLQYYFNQHIFKFEQEEYVREGILWKNIDFIDNTDCLTLFTKRRTGLLSLLDEECNFPAGNSKTLLANFNFHHQNNPHYDVPQIKYDAFLIKHYAGNVKYYVQDFREKNSDLMRNDIMLVLKNSTMSFVREIVGHDPVAILRWAILRAFFRATFAFRSAGRIHADKIARKSSDTVVERVRRHLLQRESNTDSTSPNSRQIKRRTTYVSRYRTSNDLVPLRVFSNPEVADTLRSRRNSRFSLKNKTSKPRLKPVKQLRDLKAMKSVMGHLPRTHLNSKNKPPSVSAQFNYSLQRMLKTLNEANPLFIRCIKSNSDKLPMTFDPDIVVRQLHYTGMLATVHIRRSGYNYRLMFNDFADHYKHLAPRHLFATFNQRQCISQFLMSLDLNTDNYQIGKSKVFLREAEKIHLDSLLHSNITQRVICIQRQIKTKLTRMAYLRTLNAIIKIQTQFRALMAKKKVNNLRVCLYAAISIQRMFRGFKVRRKLCNQHSAATVIQSAYRAYIAREVFEELRRQRMREVQRKENKKKWTMEDNMKKNEANTTPPTPRDSATNYSITPVSQGLRHPFSRDRSLDHKDGLSISPLRSPPMHRPQSKRSSTPPSTPAVTPPSPPANKTLQVTPPATPPAPVCSNQTRRRSLIRGDLHRDVTPPPVDTSTHLIGRKTRVIETPPRIIETVPTPALGPSMISRSPMRSQTPSENNEQTSKSSPILRTMANVPRQRKRVSPLMSPNRREFLDDHSNANPPEQLDHLHHPRPSSEITQRESELLRSKSTAANSMSKTKSLELLESLQTLQEKKPVKKRVSAPLAQQESITDSEFDSNDTSGIVYSISMVPGSPVQSSGLSRDTPSHQKKSSRLKRFVLADKAHEAGSGDIAVDYSFTNCPAIRRPTMIAAAPSSPPKIHVNPLIARGQMSQEFLKPCTAHISPGVVRRQPFNEQRSMTLPRKVNSSSYSVCSLPRQSHTMARSLKKKSTFSNSKQSLKDFLQNKPQSSNKKMKNVKSFDEYSDDDFESVSHVYDDNEQNSTTDTFQKKMRNRKLSKKRKFVEREPAASLNINNVSQWKIPEMILASGLGELDQLYNFFYSKRKEYNALENRYRKSEKENSLFEHVFSESLAEFNNYIFTMKTINREQEKELIFTYQQLLTKFQDILIYKTNQRSKKSDSLDDLCKEELPTTMGVNAFRGFLDEYLKKKENGTLAEIHKVKNKKKKKHIKDSVIIHYGHQYVLQQFSIRTFCEFCNSYIWLEKGQVCKSCKYTVHKKCYQKSERTCKGFTSKSNPDVEDGVIGVQFTKLLEGKSVPPVIEMLLQSIEKNGLYTEGIYRKSGSAVKIKKLVININKDYKAVNLDDYHVFELAAVVKKFFREMPQPLLTFELYDDFIRTSEVTDDQERLQYMFSLFQRLPPENYDLLERLMNHLAIISEFQEYNRMHASSLSVIFAPCLLRTNIALPLQDVMNSRYIAKLNQTIQTIVEVQMERRLEFKHAHNDLSKQEMQCEQELIDVRASFKVDAVERPLIDKERNLLGQINSIRQEKDDLTLTVADLEMRVSSSEDDLLSTADELESFGDHISESSMCTAASSDSAFDTKSVYYDAPTTPDKKNWSMALPESVRKINSNVLSPPVNQLQKYSLAETPYSKERNLSVRKNDLDSTNKEHAPITAASSLNPTPTTTKTPDASEQHSATPSATSTTTTTTTKSIAGQDVDETVQAEDRRPANRKPTFIQVGEEILV